MLAEKLHRTGGDTNVITNLMYRKIKNPFQQEKRTEGRILG